MQVGVGVEVGSALVPPSGSGSEPSPSARCSQTPTTITRITTRTATTVTTRKPRRTIRKRLIIRPHGAVGAPFTDITTLVEQRSNPGLALMGSGFIRGRPRSSAPASLEFRTEELLAEPGVLEAPTIEKAVDHDRDPVHCR